MRNLLMVASLVFFFVGNVSAGEKAGASEKAEKVFSKSYFSILKTTLNLAIKNYNKKAKKGLLKTENKKLLTFYKKNGVTKVIPIVKRKNKFHFKTKSHDINFTYTDYIHQRVNINGQKVRVAATKDLSVLEKQIMEILKKAKKKSVYQKVLNFFIPQAYAYSEAEINIVSSLMEWVDENDGRMSFFSTKVAMTQKAIETGLKQCRDATESGVAPSDTSVLGKLLENSKFNSTRHDGEDFLNEIKEEVIDDINLTGSNVKKHSDKVKKLDACSAIAYLAGKDEGYNGTIIQSTRIMVSNLGCYGEGDRPCATKIAIKEHIDSVCDKYYELESCLANKIFILSEDAEDWSGRKNDGKEMYDDEIIHDNSTRKSRNYSK